MDRAAPEAGLVPMSVMAGPDYYDALQESISHTQSGDRIALATMSFEPTDPVVGAVAEQLTAAADREVDVRMAVDAYALMVESTWPVPGPLFAKLPFGQERFRRRHDALADINERPTAEVSIINAPRRLLSNPIANRSHIKFSVVNNQIFIPNGNLNLTDDSDMTLAFQHGPTADWLHDLGGQLVEIGNTRDTLGSDDKVRRIDDSTFALVDAGVPGQSVILDEALRIIDETQEGEWLALATQYIPQDVVLNSLAKACMRDVDVRVPFNDPASQGLLERLPEKLALRRAGTMPPQLARGRLPVGGHKMHVKAIANPREAMGGNHNYDPRGVRLGTAELSILRQEGRFALEVGNFVMAQAGLPELPAPAIPLVGQAR
jgi:hypothetical protein